jgi:hypothetical protein
MAMRRILVGAGAVSLAMTPSSISPAQKPAGPDQQRVFLIPQTDGYGLGDCLAEGRECGKIVADAWCESKGFTRAASYGVASPTDFTGTVSTRAASAPPPAPLMISCDG